MPYRVECTADEVKYPIRGHHDKHPYKAPEHMLFARTAVFTPNIEVDQILYDPPHKEDECDRKNKQYRRVDDDSRQVINERRDVHGVSAVGPAVWSPVLRR